MFTNWNFEVQPAQVLFLTPSPLVTPSVSPLILQEPRQFWTLFPHTPDNSFLGFVVEPVAMETGMEKKNQGVVYGKEGEYAWLVMKVAG